MLSSTWPIPDWPTVTPEEQGIDSAGLARFLEQHVIPNADCIHSVMIIRNGHIVLEVYVHPYTADDLHDLRSVTKSHTSTLIGMAIERGAIQGVEAKAYDFFPDQNPDDGKRQITLEHLLTMSSGLLAGDDVTIPELFISEDPLRMALAQPMRVDPGTEFEYSTAGSHIVAGIFHAATGQQPADFAREHLFTPIGVNHFVWQTDQQGLSNGGYGLWLRPRDMARTGYLYLNQGNWNGQQIVPAEWVAASTRATGPATYYGYHWWLPEVEGPRRYLAGGYGGQNIVVVPETNLNVVITAAGIDIPGMTDISFNDILSDEPLPPNPEGLAALQTAIAALENPAPQPVPELPALSEQISGVQYHFDFEPQHFSSVRALWWKTASLTFTPGADEATFTLGTPEGDLSLQVGLDGVLRRTPMPDPRSQGAAARGAWQPDGSFVMDLAFIGEPERFKLTCQFDDQRLTISAIEQLSSMDMTATGQRAG